MIHGTKNSPMFEFVYNLYSDGKIHHFIVKTESNIFMFKKVNVHCFDYFFVEKISVLILKGKTSPFWGVSLSQLVYTVRPGHPPGRA